MTVCVSVQAADVWACGVMLFRLVAGAYPFERADERADPQRMNKMADVSLFFSYQAGGLSDRCTDLFPIAQSTAPVPHTSAGDAASELSQAVCLDRSYNCHQRLWHGMPCPEERPCMSRCS